MFCYKWICISRRTDTIFVLFKKGLFGFDVSSIWMVLWLPANCENKFLSLYHSKGNKNNLSSQNTKIFSHNRLLKIVCKLCIYQWMSVLIMMVIYLVIKAFYCSTCTMLISISHLIYMYERCLVWITKYHRTYELSIKTYSYVHMYYIKKKIKTNIWGEKFNWDFTIFNIKMNKIKQISNSGCF